MLHKTYVSYVVSPSEIPQNISMVLYVPYCKIGCPYCYNRGLLNLKEGNYTIEDIITVIKDRNRRYNFITFISITGGEVLYSQDKIIDDLRILKDKLPDIGVNIDTCLLPSVIKDELLDLVDSFRVSVKAMNEIPSSKMRHNMISNLQKITDKNIPVEYRVVVTKTNADSIKSTLETMFDYMSYATMTGVYVDKAIFTEENMGCFEPATDDQISNIMQYINTRISGDFVGSLYS